MRLVKHDSFFNDPWTDLDRLFENTFPELYQWNPMRGTDRTRSIPLDVYERDEERLVRLELPGIHKGDIRLELENAVLSVHATRKEEVDGQEQAIELSRSLTVGEDVDAEKVSAQLANGILNIHLPKKEHAKPRQISVS